MRNCKSCNSLVTNKKWKQYHRKGNHEELLNTYVRQEKKPEMELGIIQHFVNQLKGFR